MQGTRFKPSILLALVDGLDRIRFAEAKRWQAPQVPKATNVVVQATAVGPICPQASPAVGANPGPFTPGNEDCLFLNVYAPPRSAAGPLPVVVWIHGGGYGIGDGSTDLSGLVTANENGLVVVSIQYRVCHPLPTFCWAHHMRRTRV